MSILCKKKIRKLNKFSYRFFFFLKRFQKCFSVGMSKEELRILNNAKKVLNQNEPKPKNNRHKKNSPLPSVPSKEYSSPPIEQKVPSSADESFIKACVSLHKATIYPKDSQETDVK